MSVKRGESIATKKKRVVSRSRPVRKARAPSKSAKRVVSRSRRVRNVRAPSKPAKRVVSKKVPSGKGTRKVAGKTGRKKVVPRSKSMKKAAAKRSLGRSVRYNSLPKTKKPLSRKEIDHLYKKMDAILKTSSAGKTDALIKKEAENVSQMTHEVKAEEKDLFKKLDQITSVERKIENEESQILSIEKDLEKKEKELEKKTDLLQKEEETLRRVGKEQQEGLSHIESLEKNEIQLSEAEMEKLKELERLEQQIRKDVAPHPLMRITYHDFTKAIIGAFIGIVSHFAFVEGTHISETLSFGRATALFVIAFIIGFLFIYYSGFRKVKEIKYLKIFPVRIFVIYFTAMIVIFFVLFVYGFIGPQTSFMQLYNQVAAISIIAVVGAGTADLLGRE